MTSTLGPLAAFTGVYGGPTNSSGLNSIFRPQSAQTPTALAVPVPDSPNILELNVVREVLSFLSSPSLLGTAVNRGSVQADITLNPVVFYDHYIEDFNIPDNLANLETGKSIIHQEVGMWIISPATTDPDLPPTVQRLGSIPHGVAFNMQGTYTTVAGPPTIPPMNCSDAATPTGITPFVTGSNPPQLVQQPSLTATASGTARLPQDLTSFIAAGTITQAILDDPNTLLRNAIAKQNITSTTILSVDTQPAPPLVGGGVTNTAFLLSNATCLRARATFFLETVKWGFWSYPQIQYSQEILLEYGGVTYPHMTVATLTPDPLPPPLIL